VGGAPVRFSFKSFCGFSLAAFCLAPFPVAAQQAQINEIKEQNAAMQRTVETRLTEMNDDLRSNLSVLDDLYDRSGTYARAQNMDPNSCKSVKNYKIRAFVGRFVSRYKIVEKLIADQRVEVDNSKAALNGIEERYAYATAYVRAVQAVGKYNRYIAIYKSFDPTFGYIDRIVQVDCVYSAVGGNPDIYENTKKLEDLIVEQLDHGLDIQQKFYEIELSH
jgi:hypothetical protein